MEQGATKKQLAFMSKLGLPVPRDATKREASRAIRDELNRLERGQKQAAKKERNWGVLVHRAERDLAKNKAAIEATANGTASQKPSDYRRGAGPGAAREPRYSRGR